MAGTTDDERGVGSLLNTPLWSLRLPSRLQYWADRNGIETLGELAAVSPVALLREKNVGSESIAETRAVIEQVLGRPWESLAPDDSASVENEIVAINDWDAARSAYTEQQLRTPLAHIVLAPRVEGLIAELELETLADLSEFDSGRLLGKNRMGEAAVANLACAIAEHFARVGDESAVANAGLIEGFEQLISGLEPRRRFILTERSGLCGEARTLSQLGADLGITRSRVNDLEIRTFEALKRRAWAREVQRRVKEALDNRGITRLAALAKDAWWAAAALNPVATRYILGHVVVEVPTSFTAAEGTTVPNRPRDTIIGSEDASQQRATSPSRAVFGTNLNKARATSSARIDLDAEIGALAEQLAAALLVLLKTAALESVAEALMERRPKKRGASTPPKFTGRSTVGKPFDSRR